MEVPDSHPLSVCNSLFVVCIVVCNEATLSRGQLSSDSKAQCSQMFTETDTNGNVNKEILIFFRTGFTSDKRLGGQKKQTLSEISHTYYQAKIMNQSQYQTPCRPQNCSLS